MRVNISGTRCKSVFKLTESRIKSLRRERKTYKQSVVTERYKNNSRIMADHSLKMYKSYGILIKLLYFYRILGNSVSRKLRIFGLIIPILLNVAYIDMVCVTLSLKSVEWFNMKLSIAYIASLTLNILNWYVMRFKATQINHLIKRIAGIVKYNSANKLNGILIMLCLWMPLQEALLLTFDNYYNDETFYRMFMYNLNIETAFLKNTILFVKLMIDQLIPGILELLILMLYLVSCIHISQTVSDLSRRVNASSTCKFASVQKRFIQEYLVIKNLIDDIQRIFSLPTFFFCISYIAALFSRSSIFLLLDKEIMSFHTVVSDVSLILFSSMALLSLFFIAGTIPLAISDFKNALFRKLVALSALNDINATDLSILRDIIHSPETVLSGCNVIFYTMNLIPATIGTFITYSLLVVQLK